MAGIISRRNAMKTVAAAGLGTVSASCAQPVATPGRQVGVDDFWEPGPDKTLSKNLTVGSTTIRLGTGMSRQQGESLTEMVERIKDGGSTGVVTGADPWIDMPDSELSELLAALKTYDVVVFEVGSYTNMIHPDSAVRQVNLAKLTRSIEAADMLGCPMVGTISGSCDPVNFFNVHPDNWTLKTWNLLVESAKQVLRDTAGMKAALGMEAQVTTNIDGPASHKKLMEDVGDPRCAVNLDPVNMISLKNYYHTTELLEECFDTLGENILGCHAKDSFIFPATQTVHIQELAPGNGVMDYETYLALLSRMEWPRTLLPEHAAREDLDAGARYIREVAARIGVTIHGG
jgi:sugar phosphate isomerase/epimerase